MKLFRRPASLLLTLVMCLALTLAPAFGQAEVLTASAHGLLSEVTVVVITDASGVIIDMAVDCSGETQIIAKPCAEDEFLSQFIGRVGPFDDIDVVSGATITSNAVIEAVNSLFSAEVLTASAHGLLSDVTVFVTLNTDGAIATISVDCSGETQIIAAPCAEDAFLSQFIGQVGPFSDIDVVSGATITSNAVIEAVNSLFAKETLTATAMGFLDDVSVAITLDESGAIATIKVDTSTQTPGFGSKCSEPAFTNQFVGRVGPFDDIDVVSGATITSNAVIEAVNSLFSAEVLTASAHGLLSDVTVFVTLNADGAIATINVDCSGETQFLAGPCAEEPFLSQFIGRTGPFTDIDVVSGATITSNAVIEAVNSLFGGK